MNVLRQKPITTTVSMLATLLVLSIGAQSADAVVCLDSDSLVEVAASVCTCCDASEPHDGPDHPESTSTSSSCRDCVQVPLEVPPITIKTPQLSSTNVDSKASLLNEDYDVLCGSDNILVLDPVCHYRQALYPLSTVFLLT
jgi:hypothetical protein